MSTDQVRRDVTPDELDVAFAGAAPGSNRFFVTLGSTGLRIAFVEDSPTGKAYFRSAVTIHPHDGIRLQRLLKEMLQEMEPQFDEFLTAEAAKQSDG